MGLLDMSLPDGKPRQACIVSGETENPCLGMSSQPIQLLSWEVGRDYGEAQALP